MVTCSAAARWRSADDACRCSSHRQGFVSSASGRSPRCVPLSPSPWLCCTREGCPRLPEAAALRCCSRVCLGAPRRCRWCPAASTAHCQRNRSVRNGEVVIHGNNHKREAPSHFTQKCDPRAFRTDHWHTPSIGKVTSEM